MCELAKTKFVVLPLVFLATGLASADPLPGTVWTSVPLAATNGSDRPWEAGQVTVFAFYASWCVTWKDQLPRVQRAERALASLPIKVVKVSIDGRWQGAGPKDQLVFLDPGGEWTRSHDINRVPTVIVVDAGGTIRWSRSGIARTEDIVREAKLALTPTSASTVFLTFDDFPPASGGDELLDILRSQGVRATFFCVGERIRGSASLLRRAIAEGHELGCHSWSHDRQNPQLERCNQEFADVLGIHPKLIRLPGSEKVLGLASTCPIIDPLDYLRPGVSEIVRRTLLAAKPGAIIQLHVGVEQTMEALPTIVKSLRSRGYRFDLLNQRNDPARRSPRTKARNSSGVPRNTSRSTLFRIPPIRPLSVSCHTDHRTGSRLVGLRTISQSQIGFCKPEPLM